MSFLTKDLDAPFEAIRNYRPDIDGLKAISILSVILFHYASNLLPGGFVGVDVFFVISGYLIGRSTFVELKLKKFKLGAYFARRAKRIFPSLIILLLSLGLISFFILLPDEFKSLGKHIGAASVFISNWLLWREIGYFDTAAEEKPLLNLWSLGVEEQFYLVFPLIVFIGLRLKGKLFTTMLVLALCSLVASQTRIAENAAWAYYHPLSRIWELLTGAILAYGQLSIDQREDPSVRNILDKHKNLLSCIGLVLLFTAIGLYTKQTVFPGLNALLPVAGASFLIAAGPSALINKHLLNTKPLIYVGLISYPLYLWHWPLIAIPRIVDGAAPPLWVQIISLSATFVISALSYHYVERPIRFGRPSKFSKTPLLLWASLLTVGALGFTSFKFQPTQVAEPPIPAQVESPTLRLKAAIIGNSHAAILKDSVSQYLSYKGYRTEMFHQGGCTPFWNLDRHDPGYSPQDCPKDINRGISAALQDPDMDTVIFAARFEHPGSLFLVDQDNTNRVKQGLPPSDDQNWSLFESALDQTIKMLVAAHKRVIIIENVPTLSFSPKECIERPVRFASKLREPCATPKSKVMEEQKPYRDIINRISVKYPSVIVFDPLQAFCDAESCYGKIDGKILYGDNNHLNPAGVRRLAPFYNF